MSAVENRAVFLSYASQDADVARKICDALRAADVEVWFDQSELVGGDVWDAKIRGQIASCAMFMPVISASTQARREGYFRLEWRVAVERMRHMDDDLPFLVPVVIDDTKDAEAFVPERFRDVQWTRLAGGETPDAFCERVKRLLRGEVAPVVDRQRAKSDTIPAGRRPSPTSRRWLIPTLATAAVVLALVTARPWRHATNAPPTDVAQRAASPEVQALIAQMWQIYDRSNDSLREDWMLAEELGARAVKLENDNPEAWAVYSLVTVTAWFSGYDYSDAHFASGMSRAERAMSLAPDSNVARLAYANCLRVRTATRDEGERILRELVARAPTDTRVLRLLANTLRMQKKFDEALTLLDQAFALSGGDVAALFGKVGVLRAMEREREAEAVIDQILTIRSSPYAYLSKAIYAVFQHDDLEQATIMLQKVPPAFLAKEDGALLASRIWLWRRDYDRCIAALAAVTLENLMNRYTTNRELGEELRLFLTGQAHQLAGRKAAAEIEWRAGLQKIEQRLASEPGQTVALFWRTRLLASLGQTAEAERTLEAFRQLAASDAETKFSIVLLLTTLGRGAQAVSLLGEVLRDKDALAVSRTYWLAMLRHDPTFDSLRDDATFQALLAESARLGNGSSVTPRVARLEETKSVAVLAFKNLSGDPAREFFSDGLTYAVTDVLGRVPGLRVVGSTSAFAFKGKAVSIPEIARELGVSHVVEGTVLQEGTTVRITAKLLKADGFQVWISDKLDQELKNILALHDEVAGHIARNLEVKLGAGASAVREINPEAYQSYLAGRAAAKKAGMEDLRQAVSHFDRAVGIDPRLTSAWVQLAGAHTQLGRWGGNPPQQAWTAARTAIDRALALEPDSPDVLLALGWIRRTAEWDWRGAERAFRRALQLRPNHPDTLSGTAVLLFNIGQTGEAFRLGRLAAELDPLNPATQIDLSLMFFFHESWPEAERAARRALQLGPDGTGYHAVLAWALTAQRRHAEAEAELALDHSEIERLNARGMLAIDRGQGTLARECLARLEEIARTQPDKTDLQQSIAWLCAGLKEPDRAFAALAKARGSRDPSVAWSRTMWPLRPLYSDPRWKEFLRSIGLADEQLK
jgi:TolB-like protein/Flp pilus assembly protein TadD